MILENVLQIRWAKFIVGKHVTFRKDFFLMIDNKGEVSIGNDVFFNNYFR